MRKLLAVGYITDKLEIVDVTDVDFSSVPVEVEALLVTQETLIDRCALCEYNCYRDIMTRKIENHVSDGR